MKQYAIITDSNLATLYKKELSELYPKSFLCVMLSGEKSKNLTTIEKLAKKLTEKNFSKSDTLVAFGGGVVGDITGLLASLYMRGVAFINIPTTLLAMCDASIGGKNGVDTVGGKNMLGTFYHPEAVITQPKYLKTLSRDEIKNGLAEAIKMAITSDKKLFNFIEQNREKILKKDIPTLSKIITRCIEIKRKIVESDEKDEGTRHILNYGHTIGHAIEKASGYTIKHGAAVALGMLYENQIALNKKTIQKKDADRIQKIFTDFGLIEKKKMPSMKKIQAAIMRDKKRRNTAIHLYLPVTIGSAQTYDISIKDIYAVLI